MTEVELSVIRSLAVPLALSFVVTKDVLESQVPDGLVSWEAVIDNSLFLGSSALVIIRVIGVSASSLWRVSVRGAASLWIVSVRGA